QPQLLLLDEPLSSLDKKTRLELQTELKQLQQAWSIPFILVTHDMEEASTLGSQILFLEKGRQISYQTA
ncbi:MAG: ABC transporter ATP-binding protein, partial [Veillonellales bacterium]